MCIKRHVNYADGLLPQELTPRDTACLVEGPGTVRGVGGPVYCWAVVMPVILNCLGFISQETLCSRLASLLYGAICCNEGGAGDRFVWVAGRLR